MSVPLRLVAQAHVELAAKRRARFPFAHPKPLPHVHHAPPAPLGAQKFPLDASFRISLSSVKSATARFRRPFSRSSSFRRRAWLTFILPYSRSSPRRSEPVNDNGTLYGIN